MGRRIKLTVGYNLLIHFHSEVIASGIDSTGPSLGGRGGRVGAAVWAQVQGEEKASLRG